MYKNALNNIALALENDYPRDKMNNLMKRKEKCEQLFDEKHEKFMQSTIGYEHLKLSHKKNEKLPFMADCLKVISDNTGLYVKATRDLHVGDVVAIEEPFSKAISIKYCTNACTNCLKNNYYDLIPCDNCSVAMFCSPKCRDEASKKFHKYECGILQKLDKTFYTAIRNPLRVFFEGLAVFDGNMQNFMAAITENECNDTVFDFDLSKDDDKEKKKKMLLTLDLLATCSERIFMKSLVEVKSNYFIAHTIVALENSQIECEWLKNEAEKDFFKSFLHKFFSPTVIYGSLKGEVKDQFDNIVGHGIYPFASLIEESCVPNVLNFNFNGKIHIIVTRPIKKGERLLTNKYGKSFYEHSYEERQKFFDTVYSATCTCEACVKKYDTLSNLDHVKPVQNFAADLRKLSEGDYETALTVYKKYCKMVERLDEKHFPCWETGAFSAFIILALKYFATNRHALKFVQNFAS
jgi:hypothetical protein